MPDMPMAPDQQEEAPFGASSATGPTPNKGYEAAGMQRLGVIVKQLTDLLPLLGAASEPGQEILKFLPKLAKFVQPGAVSPTAERNVLEGSMIKNAQQTAMLQQLRQMAAQGGGEGGAAPQPGGVPPQAAMRAA